MKNPGIVHNIKMAVGKPLILWTENGETAHQVRQFVKHHTRSGKRLSLPGRVALLQAVSDLIAGATQRNQHVMNLIRMLNEAVLHLAASPLGRR